MFKVQYVFSQITDHLPLHTFRRCVERYLGERYVKHFKCYDQYLAMTFALLIHRESLCDIEACLQAQSRKLYHIGFRSFISRNTLADENEQRDWRIYADFAQALIWIAISAYVLIAIIKKQLNIKAELYTILQILSILSSIKAERGLTKQIHGFQFFFAIAGAQSDQSMTAVLARLLFLSLR